MRGGSAIGRTQKNNNVLYMYNNVMYNFNANLHPLTTTIITIITIF